MCSVGFNSQFGMNVKQYQQMQQMRFGTGVRQATYQPQQFSMDTSLFSAGKTNLFAQNTQSHSLNFNGVQYDNSFAMLNSVGTNNKSENDYSLKDNIKSLFKEVGSGVTSFAKTAFSTAKSIAGKVASGAKDLFNKITGKNDTQKSANVDKALGDIQNAQDKETLNQALGTANQEGQAVGQQLKADNNNLKTAQNEETKAQSGADKANENLTQANKGLESANTEHDKAKTEVQQAEDGLQSAKGRVSGAEQALEAAKSAATEENPNTAAISQAESDLSAAKQEEEQAQKKLDEAKQKETQAEQNVDKSKEQVQTAEQENTEAQGKVKEAKANTTQAQAQVQTTEGQSQEIDKGIQEGEQKMQQMEANPPVAGEAPNPDGNIINQDNVFADQDKLIEGKNYTPEQKAEIIKAREDIKNMKPGDTVKCGADTYTMDKDGTIKVNDTAGEYTNKDEAAANAGDSAMRRIDSRKQSDYENSFIRSKNGSNVKSSKTNKTQNAQQNQQAQQKQRKKLIN